MDGHTVVLQALKIIVSLHVCHVLAPSSIVCDYQQPSKSTSTDETTEVTHSCWCAAQTSALWICCGHIALQGGVVAANGRAHIAGACGFQPLLGNACTCVAHLIRCCILLLFNDLLWGIPQQVLECHALVKVPDDKGDAV